MTILKLEPGNRMIRAGFGQHNGKWFVRFDLWFVGVRFARKS